MSREIIIEQGTEAWKQLRCGLATASKFSSIMATIKSGEAAERRNYRADLVVERLTGKPVDAFQNFAMQQGIEREPLAVQAYETLTGVLVRRCGIYRHPELDAAASPDGIVDDERIGIECKCPQRATHLAYLKLDTEPPEYTWQIQGQIWIAELEAVDFVSFNPDFPDDLQLIARRIKRNDEAIKKLAGEVERFLAEVDAEVERLLKRAA